MFDHHSCVSWNEVADRWRHRLKWIRCFAWHKSPRPFTFVLNPFLVFLWWSLLLESVRERIVYIPLYGVFLCIVSICLYILTGWRIFLWIVSLVWFQFRCDISLLSSPGEAPRCSWKTVWWWKIDWNEKEESYIYIYIYIYIHVYMILQKGAVYGRKSRNRIYHSIIY